MIKGLNKIMGNGEKMKPKDILKISAGLVVSVGADIAVCSLFGSHMPAGKGVAKILCKIGSAMLAMMAGEAAEEYFYKIFDETAEALNEAKTEVEKLETEEEGNES